MNPDTKIAEAVSISSAGLDVIQINFGAEIPGFQPTAFHPLGSGSVQRVGIAGYNEISGKGMLVLAQLDFESTPGFSLTTVYDGDGLGIPQDVFSFQQSTSKVFVLDTEGNISLVRTVPGNVTVLATVSDAESLVNSWFIHGYEVVETATGVKSYSIVATDVYSSFYQYSSATNGVVVECFDTDLDGDFDEIREVSVTSFL